jgi:hypothetical protein
MHDPQGISGRVGGRVHVRERRGEVAEEGDDELDGQRFALASRRVEDLSQGGPPHPLHGEEEHPSIVVDVVHGREVRVREAPHELRFV